MSTKQQTTGPTGPTPKRGRQRKKVWYWIEQPKNVIRFDRLQQLATFLRSPQAWPKHPLDGVPSFDLQYWGRVIYDSGENVCGTTACACGLAAIAFPEWGLQLGNPEKYGEQGEQSIYFEKDSGGGRNQAFIDISTVFGLVLRRTKVATVLKRTRLGEILKEIQEPYFIGMVTLTKPDMNKRDNIYYGRVQKLSKFTGNLTFNYEKTVNRRRVKESPPEIPASSVPVFTALDRQWGTKSSLISPAVVHRDRTYLEVLVGKVSSTEYLLDGNIISDPAILAELMKFIKRKNGEVRQMLQKPAIVRDYKLESILELHTGGQTFVLED